MTERLHFRCPQCKATENIDITVAANVRLIDGCLMIDATEAHGFQLDHEDWTECSNCKFRAELWQFYPDEE